MWLKEGVANCRHGQWGVTKGMSKGEAFLKWRHSQREVWLNGRRGQMIRVAKGECGYRQAWLNAGMANGAWSRA